MDLSDIFSGSITPSKWRALGDYLQSGSIAGGPGVYVRRVGGKNIVSVRRARKSGGGSTGPFVPTLITIPATGGEPTYAVTVSDGWVNEHIPGVQTPPTNATAVHKPYNILWGDDGAAQTPVRLATDRREFAMEAGQQISVVVHVAPEGVVGGDDAPEDGPTFLAVEPENEKSVHYVPPVADDEEGASGVYHYKLAVLRGADETHPAPYLEYFLAGSHIEHWAELPLMKNLSGPAGDVIRIVKEYKKDANSYMFRALKGKYGIELEEEEDSGGVSFDGTNAPGGQEVLIGPEGDEDPFVEGPAEFRALRGLLTDEIEDITPQLQVDLGWPEGTTSGKKKNIRFRGNGTKGSLSKNGSTLLQWMDGFVTSDGDGEIPSDIGDGSNFDIKFWTCNLQHVDIDAMGEAGGKVEIAYSGPSEPDLRIRKGIVYLASDELPDGSPASEGTYNLVVYITGPATASPPSLWEPVTPP